MDECSDADTLFRDLFIISVVEIILEIVSAIGFVKFIVGNLVPKLSGSAIWFYIAGRKVWLIESIFEIDNVEVVIGVQTLQIQKFVIAIVPSNIGISYSCFCRFSPCCEPIIMIISNELGCSGQQQYQEYAKFHSINY